MVIRLDKIKKEKKMSLQVPPDVARERQIKAAQQNQLYTTAFQIFLQLVSKGVNMSVEEIAEYSIKYAKVFNKVVHDDATRRNTVESD